MSKMHVFSLRIENIHCGDCEASIRAILSKLNDKFIVEIDDLEVRIKNSNGGDFSIDLQKKIVKALEEAGFIVLDYLVYTEDQSEQQHIEMKNLHHNDHKNTNNVIINYFHSVKEKRRNKLHVKNCSKCKDEQSEEETDSVLTKVVSSNPLEFRAVFTIGGMTCASCASAVTTTIEELLKSHGCLEENKVSVDIMSNTAIVIIPNKQLANNIISAVKETGYTANLVEILPVSREVKYRVNAAIGGITCAACASSITNAVSELPFIVESAISVVSKSGVFIVDDNDNKKLNELKEAVENCGFDFEIVDIQQINHAMIKKQSRTINLKIDGMFCEHCPETINNILSSHGKVIVIDDPITLSKPFVKFTYIPSPPNLTIRSVLDEIKNSGDFQVEIIETISLDEHLRRIAKQETLKIAYRLALTIVIAIPAFIFGIVGMSLLSKKNSFRIWLDKPIIKGNTSRVTWILFFLSTPIYFFAADVFHLKAIKEIKTLWKKNVSWKRRLFRFGSMNLLMSCGTSVAYFASIVLLILSSIAKRESMGFTTTYFDSVVFLTFFLLIGRLLESFSKSKTAEAITKLGSLKPSFATLVEKVEGKEEYGNDVKTEIKMLEIGDYIRIVPGESPPIDCIIVQGETEFDESALTGESTPVKHSVGEQVFAGTINKGSKSVVAKLSSLDGTSLIDNIVNTVRDGQLKRAPIEKLADILTGYFVPLITLIAISTWIIWISLGYSGSLPQHYLDIDIGSWAVWSLEFAISVFVVACPCGIGLAAPTALFVGAGLAAKNGILARGGGSAFQEGSKVNIVCFDKTGTLTMGNGLKITNFAIHSNPIIKQFVVQVVKDIEITSSHPLAVAVVSFIEEFTKSNPKFVIGRNKVPEVEEILGKGLRGDIVLSEEDNDNWNTYKPTKVLIGNNKLMEENKVHFTTNQNNLLNEWKIQGKSVIIVSMQCETIFKTLNYIPVLIMGARDEIRPEAKNVLKSLNDDGIETWMISGDNFTTANSIAKELGIKNVIAEVLPEEKAEKIKWIKKTSTIKDATIAMIGDGINDAPALSTADVGIALATGSDLALTSSDFVLLSKKFPLISLLTLLKLSKTVFRRVRFNFCWAIIYNLIGIPIAAGVIYPYNNSRLSPIWASAAMAASSISVVLSSLALKFFKKPDVVLEQTANLQQFKPVESKF